MMCKNQMSIIFCHPHPGFSFSKSLSKITANNVSALILQSPVRGGSVTSRCHSHSVRIKKKLPKLTNLHTHMHTYTMPEKLLINVLQDATLTHTLSPCHHLSVSSFRLSNRCFTQLPTAPS